MSLRKSYKLSDVWLLLLTFSSFPLGYFIGSSFSNFNKTSSISLYIPQIYVTTNPRGAERLPPEIVEPFSDLYLRGLVGDDIVSKPKYLLALAVGIPQMDFVDKMVSKFSDDFTIMLFHYDGKTSEWDKFEWSQRAIHISALKQTKWWYAKRFLYPDIVAPYDYIFIWDEDLGLDHFNAEEYIKLVKKYGLEISQPGATAEHGLTWQLTKRKENVEVHRRVLNNTCMSPSSPPCAGFVEIMAPVFSRKAWNCVWHMIQNDLVHGWGLDFAFWKCVEKPDEKIGVVDAQWMEHMALPTLGNKNQSAQGNNTRKRVRARCFAEWDEFNKRVKEAEEQQRLTNKIDQGRAKNEVQ